MRAPLVLLCNNNQWAISTPLEAQTAAAALVDKAIGYGMPGVRVDGGDVLAVYEAVPRRSTARVPGTGRRSSRRSRTGPRLTRRPTTRRPTSTRAGRGGEAKRVRGPLRGVPATARAAHGRRREQVQAEALAVMRDGIAAAEAEPPADLSEVFDHAYADPRPDYEMAKRSLSIVEAINDCFHVELERDEAVMVLGEDVGRAGGVFRATAGLRDRFGPDRCVDTPLAEAGIMGTAIGLAMAGWRPVCEMQYDAFSYPALDQLINHVGRYRWRTRRHDGVPDHGTHAVRRRCAGAGASRRLPRDVLRAHPWREGGHPVDAGRCQGPARGGDPRPRSGRRLEPSSTTARFAARCRTASTSSRSARRAWRGRGAT